MITRLPTRGLGALACASLLAATAWAAEPIRPASGKSSTQASSRTTSANRPGAAAKGTLPDPVLLDGSSHPAEKRPNYGMVGDFELPGDENARNGRVGGGPGGQNQQQQQQQGAGGMMGLPQASGGAQPQTPSVPPPMIPEAAGGGGEQGPDNPNAGGKQVAGEGDPNGQPRGQQVAELQGQGGGPEQGEINERPQQVSIGDSAMQIQTVANAPSVVGTEKQQQSGKTQQHEKTTGTGGKAPTGNNSNRGVERGRTMPAGL